MFFIIRIRGSCRAHIEKNVFSWFQPKNHWKTLEIQKKCWKRLKKVFQPAFGCVQHWKRTPESWSKYTTLPCFLFQFHYSFDEFLSDFRWHMCIGFVTALAVMPNVLSDAQVNSALSFRRSHLLLFWSPIHKTCLSLSVSMVLKLKLKYMLRTTLVLSKFEFTKNS